MQRARRRSVAAPAQGVKAEIIQEGGLHANRRHCDSERIQRIEVYDLDADVDGALDKCGGLRLRVIPTVEGAGCEKPQQKSCAIVGVCRAESRVQRTACSDSDRCVSAVNRHRLVCYTHGVRTLARIGIIARHRPRQGQVTYGCAAASALRVFSRLNACSEAHSHSCRRRIALCSRRPVSEFPDQPQPEKIKKHPQRLVHETVR